jgi:hypothetical protein
MGTGFYTGVKRTGRDTDHQPLSSAEAKERVKVHIYSPLYLQGRLQDELYVYFVDEH